MSKVKIEQGLNGFTKVWIDGKEIRSIKECTMKFKATESYPKVNLDIKVNITDYNIDQEIKEENIKITRE